jgi:AMMECR1 domain-containing protein
MLHDQVKLLLLSIARKNIIAAINGNNLRDILKDERLPEVVYEKGAVFVTLMLLSETPDLPK